MSEDILTYTYHEDLDIHEFKPYSSKRDVIDPYMEILDRIVPETIEQNKPCALIIWNLEEAEVFPLRLQNAYFQKLIKQYPRIPPAFVLYMTDRTSDEIMIRSHYTSRKDTRKMVKLDQREDGIKWLVDCRERIASRSKR